MILSYFYSALESLNDFSLRGLLQMAFFIGLFAFFVWMFIDALRRGYYLWAGFIFIFPLLNSFLYFFMVYRAEGGGINPFSGWEWPGAVDRRRIKELERQIHFLDKPHLHLQLGEIYLRQGKLARAEEKLREAYARDPKDEDIRAKLGVCLARRRQEQAALPLLESVTRENPRHDYGETLMTEAEALAHRGETERAAAAWRRVLAHYSYPRAKVQYAEALMAQKQEAAAARLLHDLIEDMPHLTRFENKREAKWLARAKRLFASLPAAR